MKRTDLLRLAGALSLSGVTGRISSLSSIGAAYGVTTDSLFGAPVDSAAMLPDHYYPGDGPYWGQSLAGLSGELTGGSLEAYISAATH